VCPAWGVKMKTKFLLAVAAVAMEATSVAYATQWTSGSSLGPHVANTSNKGSLLIFPLVTIDQASRPTRPSRFRTTRSPRSSSSANTSISRKPEWTLFSPCPVKQPRPGTLEPIKGIRSLPPIPWCGSLSAVRQQHYWRTGLLRGQQPEQNEFNRLQLFERDGHG